jgi:hypothetical protein
MRFPDGKLYLRNMHLLYDYSMVLNIAYNISLLENHIAH